jgi:hypothetical protein
VVVRVRAKTSQNVVGASRTLQLSEKRERRRGDFSPDFSYLFKLVFIGSYVFLISSKLGELVSYFEYFNLVSCFEIWTSGESNLRMPKSVWTAAISIQ